MKNIRRRWIAWCSSRIKDVYAGTRWHHEPVLGWRGEQNIVRRVVDHGAHGLIDYSYADLLRDPKVGFDQRWADLMKVAQEVKQLDPALLSAAPPPRMEIQAPDYVHSAVRADDADRAYVLLANPDSASAANVRVTVPKGAALRILDHGEERLGERPNSQGECPLTVPPMGAMTLVVKPSL